MAEKCCNKLRFATYNCKGNGADRFEYMKCILANCDFLLVQEHWLLQNDIKPKFEKHLNNINVTGVSGMDSTKLLCGRPYGGCSIVWHKNLNCHVVPLEIFCKRCCGMIITINDIKMLLFNVYMPCDTESDIANIEEYNSILDHITGICSINTDITKVIIGGDLNTDLIRDRSLHTDSLVNFMSSECFHACLYESVSSVDFTYESSVNGTRSTIDHFLISDNLRSVVSDYRSEHDGGNLSDHSPVLLTLNIGIHFLCSKDRLYKCKPF